MIDDARLSRELEAIAERARRVLRETRTRASAIRASERAVWLLLLVPALTLITLIGGHLLGASVGKLPTPWLLALTLLPAAGYIFWRAAEVARQPIGSVEALAAVDRELSLEDRLLTAAEFLQIRERNAFMNAALADAESVLAVARDQGLSGVARAGNPGRRTQALAGLALVLLVGAWWIKAPMGASLLPSGPSPTADERAQAPAVPPAADEEERPERPEQDLTQESAEPEATTRAPGHRTSAARRDPRREMTSEVRKTRGKTTEGQAANAAMASGSRESRGTPSSVGQTSKTAKEKLKKKPKKKLKKPKPEEPDAQKPPKEQEESGATVGRGAASGSSKSPSVSPWASKDRVVSDEEEELENDEPVEDEFDDSDARGGLQPQLRDRKPPVNRDLTIGFGNQKNPDANGRGGASEQKKSRGVASLVLGVPIPDHVKGRPNPGKTKITQERVEPKPEDAPPIAAADRGRREAPVGHLHRLDLQPWMRDLLQNYYLSIRQSSPSQKAKD